MSRSVSSRPANGPAAGTARPAASTPTATRSGTRWRYVVRRSDGSMTSKRGFTSESGARDARRRMIEQVARREIVHTDMTFGEFWACAGVQREDDGVGVGQRASLGPVPR